MQNPDYMTPGRSNNLLGTQKISLTHPVHIFTHPDSYSPLITALKSQFQKKNIVIEQHHNPDELNLLIKKPTQKLFIIIDTLKSQKQSNAVFPANFTFPKLKDQNKIKIITIPNKLPKAEYQTITSPSDFITAYQKFFLVHESAKIKLRSVHKSKDVKYELASPEKLLSTAKKSPKQIFFQKLLYNDYKVSGDSDFKVLTDSIKTVPNTHEIMSLSQLKKIMENLKDNKGSKVLLLVDDNILKQYREFIEKNKLSQKIQIIVFGELKPNKQLLKQNIYFASDDGEKILTQLQKLKFQKIDMCRTQYNKQTLSKKNRFRFSQQSLKNTLSNQATYNKPQGFKSNERMNVHQSTPKKNVQQKPQLHRFSQRSVGSLYSNNSSQIDRFMRNWVVDIDPKELNKKNAQYLTMQQDKQQIQGHIEPLSKRAASKITDLRRNSSQSSESNFNKTLNNLNDQFVKIKRNDLTSSNVNILMPHDMEFQKMHNSHKQISAPQQSPLLVKHSSSSQQIQRPQSPPSNRKVLTITKKASDQRHQTKHQQMPSKVIHQMSDQYRGSNRQSIVNMDDYFYANGHNEGANQHNQSNGSSQLVNGNFSKIKHQLGQSVDNVGGGIRITSSNFVGSEKSLTSNNNNIGKTIMVREQTYMTAQNNSNSNNNIIHNKQNQQLPIQSPTHSQVNIKQTPMIDGIQQNQLSSAKNYDKKIFQTITVTPYQPALSKSEKQLGYQAWQKQNYIQGQTLMIDGKTGNLVGESQKRLNEIKIKSINLQQPTLAQQNYQQVVKPINYVEPEIVKISSSSWSIDNDNLSSRQSVPTQRKINVPNYNNGSRQDISQNGGSVTSIRQQGNYYNSNNDGITQNVRDLGYDRGYVSSNVTTNTNGISAKNLGYQTINAGNGQHYQSTRIQRIQSPRTTVSYNNYSTATKTNNIPNSNNGYQTSSASSNYKVYTPEEYAAKYGTQAAHTVLSPGRKEYNVSNTTNPYSYSTNQYNNYTSTTSSKQPQVINRVYIKASDLPERKGTVGTSGTGSSTFIKKLQTATPVQVIQRYQTPKVSIHEVTTTKKYNAQQNGPKLSAQEDPFNQKASKLSERRGSYMKRKQDSKRDPFSPYEQAGSFIQKQSVMGKQKSTVKNTGQRLLSPGKNAIKSTNQAFDSNGTQKVQQNDIGVYRIKTDPVQSNQKVLLTKTESKMIIEPLIRDNYHQSSSKIIAVSGVTRYEPSGRNYANSPTRREGSSYQKGLNSENPLKIPNHELNDAKSIVPLKDSNIKPLVYDSRSPMKVSEYKSLQPQTQKATYTYSSPTRHAYERKQISQPRVQKSNFNARITDEKQNQPHKTGSNKQEIRSKKESGPEQQIGQISRIHNRNSEVFQLSDGSIMRRNNIKFGINKHRSGQNTQSNNMNNHENSIQYLDDIKSQIQLSRINKIQEKNGQFYTLEKKYVTQKEISDEKEAYSYINTSVNEFYFLVDQDLPHIHLWLTKYLKTPNDAIEKYRGMEELYEKIKTQKQRQSYDVTLIFTKKQDIHKVNKKTLYEDAYVVEVLGDEYKGLEISQKDHKVKLGKLPYLKLVQKIIVETLLTHVILYQKSMQNTQNSQSFFSKQVAHILSLFPEGHFIKQPYMPPLTAKHIISLIDDPKFTRIYIICNQKQMSHVSDELQTTSTQSLIPQEIFKLICIPTDNEILKYESKIEAHPKVAWMTNASKIGDYKSLIKYAMRQQEDDQMYNGKTQVDEKQKIFYHIRHKNLVSIIEKQFPLRFEFDSYASMNEVERKILKNKADIKMKQNGMKVKQSMSPMSKRGSQNKSKTSINQNQNIVNYLILHPVSSDEYVDTKLFKKVFLLGKSQKTQRKVVKISTNEELLELLKK